MLKAYIYDPHLNNKQTKTNMTKWHFIDIALIHRQTEADMWKYNKGRIEQREK